MSLYVLDTDIFSLLQEGNASVQKQVAAHATDSLAITILTVEEQLSGWYTQIRRAKKPDLLLRAYQRLADAVRAIATVPILDFGQEALNRYSLLQGQKLKIGKMDLRIAAVALANGAVLVSRNVRDFEAVPNLAIENWAD